MAKDQQPINSLYTQVEISAEAQAEGNAQATTLLSAQIQLLQQLLSATDRQNELLEEILAQTNVAQKQRANELSQWKQSNPHLASKCRSAANALSRVQLNYLESVTDEVAEHGEALEDGEFMLAEFVDRFGPRLAHLNGMLQVLTQLSNSTSQ
ncbi:MAG: hypothetical protein N2C14_33075 [Planctomycetales bacterium]